MLTGDLLSQWLQRRVGTVLYGPTVRLSPSGLLRVADRPDSHQVRVALPVVHGGQAAVARAAIEGTDRALALRVQAVSSQAEQARQMERLVSVLTVAQAARADPAVYPAVLPVLESFVVTAPGDEMAVTSPEAQYELWCDVMPWCPVTLAEYQQRTGPASQVPGVVVARVVPVVATVDQVHRDLGIVHRDITPDNVLVDHTGRLLLADWGVAHTIAADQTSTHTEMVGNRGFCLPPETLAGDTTVGRYTDAWYLGCLLVWMLTGQTPGPHHGPTWLPPGLPGGPAGAQLGEVVQGLCWPDPHQRMGLADATTRLTRLSGAGPAEWAGPAPARPAVPPPVGVPGTQPTSLPHGAPPSTSLPGTQQSGFSLPPVQTDPPAARRSRTGVVVLVSVLATIVVALAGTLAWVLTRPSPTADAPPSPSSTPTPTSTCWTATVGECPDFDTSVVSYWVFKGFVDNGDVVSDVCYPATAQSGTVGTFALCGWEDLDVWARVSKFTDTDAMTAYYLDTLGYAQTTDAPPWAAGPDGPVFTYADADQTYVAYCFSELPMCLEATGTADSPVTKTTQYFHAITPAEAHRVVEYLANR